MTSVFCVPVSSQGWYSWLCGNGCCASLSDSLRESLLEVFELSVSLVWLAIWCWQDLWSGHNRKLLCEQLLVPSAQKASCNWALGSLTTRLSNVVSYVSVFTRLQLSCSTAALALAGQPLSQQSGATQCCALLTIPWDKFSDPPHPYSGSLDSHPTSFLTVPILTLPPLSRVGSVFYLPPLGSCEFILCLCCSGGWNLPIVLDYLPVWACGTHLLDCSFIQAELVPGQQEKWLAAFPKADEFWVSASDLEGYL
jgi:hypothetical protein